ncbi:DUF364 domain-containing protein [Methanospirillum hungatei]|jgi:uncharacterized protein (DUF4213/DUF364 family)|uniref:Rossmann-like domain-containing protein n=1 Tax=Methanospirillum hungatei TaxID=2203 RepID=UPI0009D5D6B7|nr:DUF364 domain-containing protein [Methanospirillum hungatei]MBP9007298.1 Fis family transcriptional regulator [Methanospirillum sp.]OQA57643.1 MAG: hypothetical protein BWY45_01430 [Euryarchaeota archaeon ADurb.Bin294]HOW03988.1 DUF364 domain-containing protein [Methanospirillum hungatei]
MNPTTEKQDAILSDTIDILKTRIPVPFSEIRLDSVVVGVFFTGVKLSSGYGGICFTPVDLIPEAVCCSTAASAMPYCGKMQGVSVEDMLTHMSSPAPLVRAVIISVVNALSAWFFDICPEGTYAIEHDKDAFDLLNTIDPATPVVVVGALWPVIHRLKLRGAQYRLFELNKGALREEELPFFVPPEEQNVVLSRAGCVVLTGATLVTGTLENLLARIPQGIPVIIGGPTVSMIPDAFFSRGVTAIGGDIVTRPDEILSTVMQGGSGYHFFGKAADKILIHNV